MCDHDHRPIDMNESPRVHPYGHTQHVHSRTWADLCLHDTSLEGKNEPVLLWKNSKDYHLHSRMVSCHHTQIRSNRRRGAYVLCSPCSLDTPACVDTHVPDR